MKNIKMYMFKKIDPLTNLEFETNKRTQVFSSAKNRVDFHNKKAALIRLEKTTIDRILTRNYKILKELAKPNERVTITLLTLETKGFNPNYFTHLSEYESKPCRCIYQFQIPQSVGHSVTIINTNND